MNIGIVAMEFPPDPVGGIGAFAQELAGGLVAEGHRVMVVVPNLGPGKSGRGGAAGLSEELTQPLPGLKVLRWHYEPARAWRWRPGQLLHRWQLRQRLKKLHREDPFDIVETQDLYGPLPFGGMPKVPLVVRHHSSAAFYDHVSGSTAGDPMTYWLERRTFHQTRFHVAVSEFVGQGVCQLFGIPKSSVRMIHYGIDTGLFQPAKPPSDPVVPGRIVFVNSVVPRKGVKELCQAFSMMADDVPGATLRIIGRNDARTAGGRPYADECVEGISEPIRKRIEFTGPIPRGSALVSALHEAAVCCFPSKLETFGIAPLEAMSAGRPVIYMRHGPGPEIITHGKDGLLCDTSSPSDIAARLVEVLKNPDFAMKLGGAARQRALHFSRDSWIQKNLNYYQEVCRAHS